MRYPVSEGADNVFSLFSPEPMQSAEDKATFYVSTADVRDVAKRGKPVYSSELMATAPTPSMEGDEHEADEDGGEVGGEVKLSKREEEERKKELEVASGQWRRITIVCEAKKPETKETGRFGRFGRQVEPDAPPARLVSYMNGQSQEERSTMPLSTKGCTIFGGSKKFVLPFAVHVCKIVLMPRALNLAEVHEKASEPLMDISPEAIQQAAIVRGKRAQLFIPSLYSPVSTEPESFSVSLYAAATRFARCLLLITAVSNPMTLSL